MPNLFEKLDIIKQEISVMQKDGKGYGFEYITPKKLFPKFNQLARDNKVYLFQEITEHTIDIVPSYTKNGEREAVLHNTKQRFTFINLENIDEKLVCEWSSSGCNGQEMGFGSAVTYGKRYFLLSFFNISDGEEDPDNLSNNRKNVVNDNQDDAPTITQRDISDNKQSLKQIEKLLPQLYKSILPIVDKRSYAEFSKGISGQVRNWIKDNTKNIKPYLDTQKQDALDACNYMQLVAIVELIQTDNAGE